MAKSWTFLELPFLKEEDFVVTETYPINLYLVNKANRKDLIGKTIGDEAKVDMFLCQSQITSDLLCFFVSTK